jgi:hypothetical protein
VSRPSAEIFNSVHGVALILDHYINVPDSVHPSLRRAITEAEHHGFDFDYYEEYREDLVNGPDRAQRIINQNLARNQGSSTGWEPPARWIVRGLDDSRVMRTWRLVGPIYRPDP